MAISKSSVLALGVLIAACVPAVLGHAGHFHLCPDTPSQRGYVRNLVGTCTQWTNAAPQNTSAGVQVQGTVLAWIYAYQNNTNLISSALEMNVTLSSNGQPLANTPVYGYAHTGSCSAPGAWYMQNLTAGADDENMIFWNPTPTDANGGLCGNAANSIVMRTIDSNGVPESNPLRSLVVYTNSSGAVSCCDLNMTAKPPVQTLLAQLPATPAPPPPTSSPTPSPVPSPGAASAVRLSVASALGAVLLSILLLR